MWQGWGSQSKNLDKTLKETFLVVIYAKLVLTTNAMQQETTFNFFTCKPS